MKKLKQFIHSGTMVTLVWVLGIAAVWEGFAFYVAQTKRTPLNVLPHLWQIIGSFFSDKMITGQMTMMQLIGTSCGETLSRGRPRYCISCWGRTPSRCRFPPGSARSSPRTPPPSASILRSP